MPKEILKPELSLKLANVTIIIAFILSYFMPSIMTRVICWIAILLSWGYSAPPLALCRRGLGKLTTTIVLNILTPLLGFLLQQGQLYSGRISLLILVLLPLAIIEFIRMMVMNMPDREWDAAVVRIHLLLR